MLSTNPDRRIDYLRLSVTDRCNLRCVYCMPPEGIATRPHHEILSFEEILRLVSIFADLGVRKVRLTGGEPLVRNGVLELIESLARIDAIDEVCLTTNGLLLKQCADELKKAGLSRLNISLDTLRPERFRAITKSNSLADVIKGIDEAKRAGFHSLKLNMVVMKGINDDEITDFIDFALRNELVLRFIEFMKVTPLWDERYFLSIDEVKRICEKKFRLRRMEKTDPSPATYYEIQGGGRVGFINTNENNCMNCTRLRLTSSGQLKRCLYETSGLDLKHILRTGTSDDEIRDAIKAGRDRKRDLTFRDFDSQKVYMCDVGG